MKSRKFLQLALALAKMKFGEYGAIRTTKCDGKHLIQMGFALPVSGFAEFFLKGAGHSIKEILTDIEERQERKLRMDL